MPIQIRENTFSNHVIDDGKPLDRRRRALIRLRDPHGAIEALSDAAMSVSNFVMDLQAQDLPDNEYYCASCGAHAIIYGVKVAGQVDCACGPLEGKPL